MRGFGKALDKEWWLGSWSREQPSADSHQKMGTQFFNWKELNYANTHVRVEDDAIPQKGITGALTERLGRRAS